MCAGKLSPGRRDTCWPKVCQLIESKAVAVLLPRSLLVAYRPGFLRVLDKREPVAAFFDGWLRDFWLTVGSGGQRGDDTSPGRAMLHVWQGTVQIWDGKKEGACWFWKREQKCWRLRMN
jgi:hypothetical protein